MPRQNKADALLAAREEATEREVRAVAVEVERLNSELALVRKLRKELAALPKRKSRNKPQQPPETASA